MFIFGFYLHNSNTRSYVLKKDVILANADEKANIPQVSQRLLYFGIYSNINLCVFFFFNIYLKLLGFSLNLA
jgi:hypothetical protein